MTKIEMPVDIRTGQAEDVAFIMNSWLKAHRESDECRYIDYALYYKHLRPLVVNILTRSSVFVAANPDDLGQIYGYVVVEYTEHDTILHYAYTKYTFRRFGVCKQLLEFAIPELGKTPIFATFAGKQYPALKDRFNLAYNPFAR